MSERVVILGAGIAGVQLSGMLKDMDVTLVTEEKHLPYYRMRLEEVVSKGAPESIAMHPASWYEERNIRLVEGRASAIDRANKSLIMEDGSSIAYDKLVLATGSSAVRFPIEGRDSNVLVLRNMDDALLLRKKAAEAPSVLIVGGGLLGLELALCLCDSFKAKVTVLDRNDYLLNRQLDRASSEILRRKLEERGVAIETGGKLSRADDEYAYLEDGRRIEASLIVLSAGVRSNTSLASDAGIECERGIIIDSAFRTSDDSVFAIGDACQLGSQTFGLAMYAREMAMLLAKGLAGEDISYVPSAPSSVLKVAGIDIAFFGIQTDKKVVEESGDSRKTVFLDDEGIVRGVILINMKSSMLAAKAMLGKAYAG